MRSLLGFKPFLLQVYGTAVMTTQQDYVHPYKTGDVPPEGITLGRKVILVPPVSRLLDRALWIQHCSSTLETFHKPYTWIRRGDPFAKVFIYTPKTPSRFLDFFVGQNLTTIFLCSPVSGMILRNFYDFGDALRDRRDGRIEFSILLPDDESPAENGEYIFSKLSDFVWYWRDYIFRSGSAKKELNYDDDRILKELNEMKARKCVDVDALPRYVAYFDEARTMHPQLRPYLKHLQA